MRKLILLMSVSMDGYAARSDGTMDWMAPGGGPDHGGQRHRINLEALHETGLIVIGGGVYPEMVRGWADSDNAMARLINPMPKVVFSHSLESVEWNATLSRRPLAEHISELKAEDGGDIVVFGGARIANSLIRERLVDEFRLTVHPVMQGEGMSIMQGLPEPQRLELVSSTVYADGSVMQVLRPL
jgi:dihydrofolate reductase